MVEARAATPIKGAPVAAAIRSQVEAALAGRGVRPCLANVVVGEDPASASYLDSIDKLAGRLGLESRRVELPAASGEAALRDALARLGADPGVHGILLQFPLPEGFDSRRVAAAIPPAKDVDGITEASLGAVLAGQRRHTAPCTAAAVVELLASDARLSPERKHVVVVGRSLVVGRPLAAMLAAPLPGGQATVTLCHTRTPDVGAHTRRADIVVVAAGVRALLQPGQVRPGAIVIDVGTHPVPAADGSWTLAGDVDPEVAAVAGWLSPVPGGVGPVTNAVLMRHVTAAALPGYLEPAW
ncbi:MAG TPA: bifunctional 5,10-methylenetetrahydrofolate dehydrogenase/5,10-methenyltetrahydrofolate cyclohydrolase [Planctomycetota bacterium]|nr:bifunctional 5,10-methylenetetrahydrofolate dehydrogenase/5,10-methenyltetrahydrofolate cyclohydrolase [Planctomycetota bacterium]